MLQRAVERIRDNINNLGKLKANGYDGGSLNWKKPREYRSFTYRQSGFELDTKSGPNGRGLLILKKFNGNTREIPVRLHRDLPDHEQIKEVTLKKEATGAWYVSFCIKTDTPPKPEDIDSEDTGGLDLGVLNFVHDSDGRSVNGLICLMTASELHASNARSHGNSTVQTTGSNNATASPRCTLGCRRKNRSSNTSSRTSTSPSATPYSLKTST